MQGLYEVAVPRRPRPVGWAISPAPTDTFPMCVTENPAESRLDALTPDEQAIILRQADITVARSFDDLQSALRGKTFGRELWRIPALALFALLLLEAFLTRWICIQRTDRRGGGRDGACPVKKADDE
jgi:hypothetical protein